MPETNSLVPLEKTTDETRPANAVTTSILDASGSALSERLGVGGMGEVYRFGDDALQRDLAIKVLKGELRGNADAEQRFLREARLAGSLQHPGVVPIHQLGRLADGRPCYTMKLVRGRTLSDLLRDEPDGPERLPRLLAILEKVCQAVAYAHSKHVIHRDLKPNNVMVGEFGEVQVMDWGLAKELHESEPTPPPEATEDVATAAWTKEGEGLSRAGSALGTAEYMPPEQAAGDWDIVDERADVFALGALSCAMLTGRPPYHGGNRADLLRRARRGDLAEALGRLEKCGADAVLVDLCGECLAADRLQRPRHAGVVAERLAAYQAEVQERLRRAELERVAAEVRAAAEAERAREAHARAKAELQAKQRMLALFLAAVVILCLVSGGGWWIARERTARAEETAVRLVAVARANEAGNYYMRGEILYFMDQQSEAIAEYRKALQLQPDNAEYWYTLAERFYKAKKWDEAITAYESVIRLKPDHAIAHDSLGDALRKNGQADRAIEAYREAIRLEPDYAEAHNDLGFVLDDKGQGDEAIAEYREAIRLKPNEADYHIDLGIALRDKGQLDEAIAEHREAIRLKPDDAYAHDLLGNTLYDKGQFDEAVAEYRRAIRLKPDDAVYHTDLGIALRHKGQLDEAITEHCEAIRLKPDYAGAHKNLGIALEWKGHLDEAVAKYREAIRLKPDDPIYQTDLGIALRFKGDLNDAMACYNKALDLDPKYPNAHIGVGNTLRDRGDLNGAIACYQKALDLDPKIDYAHRNLANALCGLQRLDEAAAEYRKAIELGNAASAQQLQRCQRLLALGERLQAILQGEIPPAAATQQIDLAVLTYNMGRYGMSSRLYASAFAAEPKLAADLIQHHRYYAACSAALAAARQGKDTRLLPDKVVAMFRRWSLGWLRDHLSVYAKLAERTNPDDNKMIQEKLASWRRETDLASLREPQALERLPEIERAAWQALWRDVDELAKSATDNKKAGAGDKKPDTQINGARKVKP